MSGVDNRIVTMQFNNSEFERNAKTSLTTLQKIKESMNFGSIASGTTKVLGGITGALQKIGSSKPFTPLVSAAQKGFGTISGVIGKLGLRNPFATATTGAGELARASQIAAGPSGIGMMEGGVTAVSNKFLLLSTIAITAISNITNKILNATTQWVKGFTFSPILDGLHEYETNLKSIQTVQANTDRPLTEINKSLDELNKYSDLTIYNFSEMARNVGTFTAAGVDLQTSVSSIKGIANLAALSGSSSEQAATAMYQLSQAIAAGRVGLMDWNSVVNAGMGGKKLQNALAQTAAAMGEIDASAIKMVGPMKKLEINGSSFRESIMAKPGEEPWLSSDALVNTLSAMDGRFSRYALSVERLKNGTLKYKNAAQITAAIDKNRADLAKKGVKYTDEQFNELQKMSTQAVKSATQVKTLGQVFDIVKETIGSGWSASFRSIFGNLDEAKKTFTGMKDAITGVIGANDLARNNMLAAWKKLGGRTAIIDGIKNVWTALGKVLGPIKAAFRDIFPRKSAQDLVNLSKAFRDLMERMIPSGKTMHNIRLIARGVFSAFHILWQVVQGIGHGFKTLFDLLGGGKGNFLDFAASIGQNITKFDQWLEKSGVVTAFFEGLAKVVSVPIKLLAGVGHLIGALFTGFNAGDAESLDSAISNSSKKLQGVLQVGDKVRAFFDKIAGLFDGFGQKLSAAMGSIGDLIANAFSSENYSKTLDTINTGLLAGILLLIRNFFKQGVNIDLSGGLFDGIKQTLGSATEAFQTMQQNLKANILLKLAAAMGAMALSLLVLSGIDPAALSRALGAMAGGFALIIGAMVILMKYMGPVGIAQIYVVTSGMTKMSFSILLLSFALKTLSGIKFGDMVRGLVGLASVMFILTKAMLPLAAGSKGMARAATSMILVGIAMNLLAVAVKIFATMDWPTMIRGMAGLIGTLIGVGLALKLMPKGILLQSVAILAIAVAMNALGIALKIFATMSWEEIAKGIGTVAGALLAISLGMRAMPKGMVLQAAALVAVAGAMVVLSAAIKIFSKMGWEEIAKGLIVMGGAMLIMAVGLDAIGISGAIGAVGLLAAAVAMNVMLPVLLAFSAMSWEGILKSLALLAGIFIVLGVAAYSLAPVTPVIIGLGLALLLLGAGLALAGAGALAAATAFNLVVAAGSAGAQVLRDLLSTIIAAIPAALVAFGKGIVGFAQVLGVGAPKIAEAFGKIVNRLIQQAIQAQPKIARLFLALINTMYKVTVQGGPKLAEAGLILLAALLHKLDEHVGDITETVVKIIAKFILALAKNQGRVIDAGAKFIIKFINGLADAIDANHQELYDACKHLGEAIINAIKDAVISAATDLAGAVVDAAKGALDAAGDFLGIGGPSKLFRDEVGKPIGKGIAEGIKQSSDGVTNALTAVNKKAVNHMANAMRELEDSMSLNGDLRPTIAPVLDLTAMAREASRMEGILAVRPIVPTTSYLQASEIATATEADRQNRSDSENSTPHVTEIKVEQNNTYPKEPAVGDQYRDTKSLFSLVTSTIQGG